MSTSYCMYMHIHLPSYIAGNFAGASFHYNNLASRKNFRVFKFDYTCKMADYTTSLY